MTLRRLQVIQREFIGGEKGSARKKKNERRDFHSPIVAPTARRLDRRRLGGAYRNRQRAAVVQPSSRRRYDPSPKRHLHTHVLLQRPRQSDRGGGDVLQGC